MFGESHLATLLGAGAAITEKLPETRYAIVTGWYLSESIFRSPVEWSRQDCMPLK